MRWMLSLSLLALLCACVGQPPGQAGVASPTEPQPPAEPVVTADPFPLGEADAAGYRELDWLAMMPPEELAALERGEMPEVDHDGDRTMAQFGSYRTVDAVLGKRVRLPGYVVPLDGDDAGRIREFLFVPYYGACIHVPPPPPNQIVYVHLDAPIDPPDMYMPFFLSGRLRAQPLHGELAGSAYTMIGAGLRPYEEG